ncbi:MAG: signal peptidase I [Planctomycetota bacterium]
MRSPWIAAVLSLLLSGLGHLYAGLPRKALAFYFGEIVAWFAWVLWLVIPIPGPWNMIAGVGGLLGWRLATSLLAFRDARRQPPCRGRPAWVRWPVYAVVWLAGSVAAVYAVNPTFVRVFEVRGGAMMNTILAGEDVFAVRTFSGSPQRGEVVAFRKPDDVLFVFRLVGLPGERVEVRGGYASVGGRRLDEPYVFRDSADFAEYGPKAVPAGTYFFLGDRRNASRDSRSEYPGFVATDRVFARVRAIFWSRDPETGAIRWDRIGRRVR